MKEIKNDVYYLNRIKSDIDFISSHMQGVSVQEFKQNEVLKDAMLFRIIQVDENNQHLTSELKATHKNKHWVEVQEMRDILEKDYALLDLNKAYEMLTITIPKLIESIK